MRISHTICFFLAAASLFSCSQQFKETSKSGLPNLDSLRANAIPPPTSVRKISDLNGFRDSVVISGGVQERDAVMEKLRLFNKPVFTDQYRKLIVEDSQSNLQIERWLADTKQAPIQQLEIYFNEQTNTWYAIKAIFKANNLLFKKEESIFVGLDPTTSRIEAINITGKQKMFFFEEDNYSIDLKLLYP